MKLLSILLLILSIISALVLTGNINSFFDGPSFLVVVLPVIASIPARHGFLGFKLLLKDEEERKEVLHSMGITGIISGVLGTHIGVVIMLGQLEESSSLGPSMGVAVLPTFYGLFIFLLTTILSHLNLGKEV